MNLVLQALIDGEQNDGLVCESSSDAATALGLKAQHHNDYQEYPKINHTALTANQSIIHMVTEWVTTNLG